MTARRARHRRRPSPALKRRRRLGAAVLLVGLAVLATAVALAAGGAGPAPRGQPPGPRRPAASPASSATLPPATVQTVPAGGACLPPLFARVPGAAVPLGLCDGRLGVYPAGFSVRTGTVIVITASSPTARWPRPTSAAPAVLAPAPTAVGIAAFQALAPGHALLEVRTAACATVRLPGGECPLLEVTVLPR
jgi:hypothetical protein